MDRDTNIMTDKAIDELPCIHDKCEECGWWIDGECAWDGSDDDDEPIK